MDIRDPVGVAGTSTGACSIIRNMDYRIVTAIGSVSNDCNGSWDKDDSGETMAVVLLADLGRIDSQPDWDSISFVWQLSN